MPTPVAFKTIATQLDEIASSAGSINHTDGLFNFTDSTFLLWQLAWSLSMCGLAPSSSTLSWLRERIFQAQPTGDLETIQHAWMRYCDLPGYDARYNLQEFYDTVHRVIGKVEDNLSNDEFIQQLLRKTVGLPVECESRVKEVIEKARAMPTKRHLSAAPQQPENNWLPLEDVATRIAECFSSDAESSDRIVLVALPPPLSTPMSWSLATQGSNDKHFVYLGWPQDSRTQMTGAEQLALLAHERCHIHQLLLETGPMPPDREKTRQSKFARELDAIRAEWKELHVQSESMTSKERDALTSRWLNFNEAEQIALVKKDLVEFEQSRLKTESSRTHLDIGRNLRMPFSTVVYAICARMVQPQGLEPRTPAV